jgi:hypothetical protein
MGAGSGQSGIAERKEKNGESVDKTHNNGLTPESAAQEAVRRIESLR